MQVRGTFPELNAGMKRSTSLGKLAKAVTAPAKRAPAKASRKAADPVDYPLDTPNMSGFGGFAVRRAPRAVKAPNTLSGRRNASRAKFNANKA